MYALLTAYVFDNCITHICNPCPPGILFFKPVEKTKELPIFNRVYLQNNFKKANFQHLECDSKKTTSTKTQLSLDLCFLTNLFISKTLETIF